MTINVEATYENGVLKLAGPVPLQEHEKVQVTIHTGISVARQSAGLIRWTGDAATLEKVASDPELGLLESP